MGRPPRWAAPLPSSPQPGPVTPTVATVIPRTGRQDAPTRRCGGGRRMPSPDVMGSHPDDRGGPVPDGHVGPGVAAAGAQAASFPIHFGRHPTPERTAYYASRTTLGGVFPERLRPLVEATAELSDRFAAAGHSLYLVGGSVRDAIVAEPGTGDADGGPRLHHRRATRRHRGGGVGMGRRRMDPGQAVRHHRVPSGRPEVRDHHPPGRGLPARLPQARGGLRRPVGGRPGAAGTSPSTPWPSSCPISS